MVATVVQSGLGQDFHQPADVDLKEAAATISETPQQDLWVNIFPPTLLRPAILPVEGSPDVFGMYDAEDQVYRCLDCMHEIWGGSCSQCGRHYSGHDVDASDENASGEEHRARWSILPAMERIMGWPHDNVDESDGSYESSFIDDDNWERRDSEAVEISSGNDGSTTLASRRNRSSEGGVRIPLSDDSEDGDENVSDNSDESQKKTRRPALGTRRQVLSESDVYVF